MSFPRATQRERDIRKTLKLANARGQLVKTKVHSGHEVIRTGFCFQHSRHSSVFVGENEKGWVFWCKAPDGEPPEDGTKPLEIGHYFVNEPA